MNRNKPVEPRVRLAIARWPDDAPRGAVSTFRAEHGITRKTFYALRKRADTEGPASVLEPRSRRPKTSPTRITEETKQHALHVRVSLEASGLDHGPISVHDKTTAMGMSAPSIASLARILRDAGVARLEPRKKPQAAYRRFVYPAPNACWQLDATEYVLAQDRKCVIFQLEDDHSRIAVASHVAGSETTVGALAVFNKGVDSWDATEIAEPPRPQPVFAEPVIPDPPASTPVKEVLRRKTTTPAKPGEYLRKVRVTGGVPVRDVAYQIGHDRAGEYVHVIIDSYTISFFDTHTGELLIGHSLPEPGFATWAMDSPGATDLAPSCHRSPDRQSVTDVLRQNCHR